MEIQSTRKASEVRVVVLTSGLNVREAILRDKVWMIPNGGKTLEFQLRSLLILEHGLPFCNQEVRIHKSGDRICRTAGRYRTLRSYGSKGSTGSRSAGRVLSRRSLIVRV